MSEESFLGDRRGLARREQRGAEQRGAFVEHEPDGSALEQWREAALGAERGEEAAVLEARAQLGRDAARDVDAARRHVAQREVAGLGAVGGDEEVERAGRDRGLAVGL